MKTSSKPGTVLGVYLLKILHVRCFVYRCRNRSSVCVATLLTGAHRVTQAPTWSAWLQLKLFPTSQSLSVTLREVMFRVHPQMREFLLKLQDMQLPFHKTGPDAQTGVPPPSPCSSTAPATYRSNDAFGFKVRMSPSSPDATLPCTVMVMVCSRGRKKGAKNAIQVCSCFLRSLRCLELFVAWFVLIITLMKS